jgi:sporulation protein YlmC with PRC-barrel domain
MRTLSSLQERRVVTESGRSLGRCYDLRGELTGSKLRIVGLRVGRKGWLAHLGLRRQVEQPIVPWAAVVRIEGKRIVVRDDVLL